MPRISRYNHETHKLEWVEATPDEYAAWLAGRKAARAKTDARKAASGASTPSSRGETLDDAAGGDAVRQAAQSAKSAPAPKPSAGPLTPLIGLLSRLGAIGLIRASGAVTVGRHPMTPPEAVSIAAPALRIVDRELGKRVKWTPKGGPNARDLEQIGTAVVSYVLRSLFGGAIPMPGPLAHAPTAATAPMPASAEAFDDQEQEAVASVGERAAPMPDESDLFSGSEPLDRSGGAGGATAPATSRGAAASDGRRAGPPGAVAGVPESVWNALSPPEMGLADAQAVMP